MDVTPGAPWRPPTAGEHNGWEQARREFEQRIRDRQPNNLQTHRFSDDRLRIRNSSGSDLPRGSVLQIGASLLNPENPPDGMMVNGIVPDGSCACYAILRYAIPNGEINEGHVTGVCFARVNVLDITHVRAAVVASGTNLESGIDGQYEILSTLTSTGMQEVWVAALHPCGQGDSEIFWPTLTSCLQPGGTAWATLNGVTITVRDPYYWNFAIPGERLPVHATGGGRGCGLSGENFRVIGSHGLMRRIESTSSSPVECLDVGNAKVLGDENDPPCAIEYVNDSCDTIEEGRTGFAMYNRATSTWYATFRPKPRFAIATLTSPLCPEDEQAAVEGVEAVDCSTCGTLEVSSPIASTWGAAGEEGDAVFAFRKDDGTWDVLTAVHKSFTPLVDLENGATCGEAGGKTRQISAMFCTTDEEDVALALGETVVVEFSSRFDSECNFQVRTIELCVLGASNPSEWFTKKTAQEVTVVDTLSVSTSTSEMLVGTSKVRVLCAGPGDDYPLDLCVYCDPPPPPPSSSPPSSSSPDTECEICGENDVPHTISLSISFSGSLDGYTLEATATWDEGAEEWQLPGDDTLLLDGVPNSSYLVQGQFVCVDDVLTLALTIASGEEDCTHVYEFSFASPSVSSGTLTASATEEVVDCPVCPGTAGQPNGTEVERVVADQLQIHFDAWAENMSFQVALYRCDGEYLRSSACGGVEAGATMQETNSTPPFLDGAGDDWYVVIKWYSGDTCATTVRTDVVLSPTSTTCEQPGTCEITVDIEADVSDCEAPPSSSSGGGCSECSLFSAVTVNGTSMAKYTSSTVPNCNTTEFVMANGSSNPAFGDEVWHANISGVDYWFWVEETPNHESCDPGTRVYHAQSCSGIHTDGCCDDVTIDAGELTWSAPDVANFVAQCSS